MRYINISGNPNSASNSFILLFTFRSNYILKKLGKLGVFLECIFDYLTDVEEILIKDFGDISEHLHTVYMQIVKKKKRLEGLKIFDLSGTYFVPQNEE